MRHSDGNMRRNSIPFDPPIEKMAKEQMKAHRNASMTDFMRGLVIFDKLLSNDGVME